MNTIPKPIDPHDAWIALDSAVGDLYLAADRVTALLVLAAEMEPLTNTDKSLLTSMQLIAVAASKEIAKALNDVQTVQEALRPDKAALTEEDKNHGE